MVEFVSLLGSMVVGNGITVGLMVKFVSLFVGQVVTMTLAVGL